jgi:hypothetical protein
VISKVKKFCLSRVFQSHTLIFLLCAFSAMAQSPVVSEFVLESGVRVLHAPRPGSGAVHAAWFIEGESNGIAKYPLVAADMLLAAWFADFDTSGASGFWANVSASGISHGRDIAPDALEDWCRAELVRFSQVLRQDQIDSARRFLQSQRRVPDPMIDLCALVSTRNTSEASEQKNAIEPYSISINDLQVLAGKYVSDGQFLIVLIGDLEESLALKTLNNFFGGLELSDITFPKAMDAPQKDVSKSIPLEERKREIPSESKTEVLVAWQIPPHTNGSWPNLELYAEILAGHPYSRLIRHLVLELGYSNDVQVSVGVQAEGAGNLFVIRADVTDGHTAQEVERVILSEVLSSLHDRLQDEEIIRALHRLDVKQALRLADASGLAQALIHFFENADDWRLSIARASNDINSEPQALANALRAVFHVDSHYSVLAVRDPICSPKNQEEARLVSLLLRKSEGKSSIDPNQRENLIKSTVLLFGLMPGVMRAQLFSLLETETGQ